MLALTMRADYALIAATHLARHMGQVECARGIAEAYHLPLPILTNILKTLARAGIIVGERGSAGGYRLGRAASAISLHELITAIEGPLRFVRCVEPGDTSPSDACGIEATCPIRLPVARVHQRLKAFLEQVTLAELAEYDEDRREPEPVQLGISIGGNDAQESSGGAACAMSCGGTTESH